MNALFSDCYFIQLLHSVTMAAMNSDLGGLAGRPTNSQPNPFESALYGAGPGLIRTGLGAYGEKFLGSSSEFMQSNVSFYTSFFCGDLCILSRN